MRAALFAAYLAGGTNGGARKGWVNRNLRPVHAFVQRVVGHVGAGWSKQTAHEPLMQRVIRNVAFQKCVRRGAP